MIYYFFLHFIVLHGSKFWKCSSKLVLYLLYIFLVKRSFFFYRLLYLYEKEELFLPISNKSLVNNYYKNPTDYDSVFTYVSKCAY